MQKEKQYMSNAFDVHSTYCDKITERWIEDRVSLFVVVGWDFLIKLEGTFLSFVGQNMLSYIPIYFENSLIFSAAFRFLHLIGYCWTSLSLNLFTSFGYGDALLVENCLILLLNVFLIFRT